MASGLENAQFYRSSPDKESLPTSLKGILFVGRSNAGKSTLINALTGKKGLMKTSSLPGKTRMLNFASVQGKFFLIDSPGYGFEKSRDYFEGLMDGFFEKYVSEKQLLRAVVMVMDARRALENPDGVGQGDRMMEDYARRFLLPIIAVFTKADKLSGSQKATLRQIYGESHKEGLFFLCSPKDKGTYEKLGQTLFSIGCGKYKFGN